MKAIIPVNTQLEWSLPFDMTLLAGQIGPSTRAIYLRDIKAYLHFAGTPERAIDHVTLIEWRTYMAAHTTLSPNTINRMLSAVKKLMSYAADMRLIDPNEGMHFKLIKGVKPLPMKQRLRKNNRTKITREQMEDLVYAPDLPTLKGKRDHALLLVLATSGVRATEATTLTKEQIVKRDGNYFLLVQGKTDANYREAPLSSTAFEAIEAWLSVKPIQSVYLFPSMRGRGNTFLDKPLTETSLWELVRHYAGQVGLQHVKPHDFRRYVGTILAKDNLKKAQLALGHKSSSTTADHYDLNELEGGITEHLVRRRD